jgi:hypothetical protein
MFASSMILGGDGSDWFANMVRCCMWVPSVGCLIDMECHFLSYCSFFLTLFLLFLRVVLVMFAYNIAATYLTLPACLVFVQSHPVNICIKRCLQVNICKKMCHKLDITHHLSVFSKTRFYS